MRAMNLRILEESCIILKNWFMADIGDTGAWEAIKNRGCIHLVLTEVYQKRNERMQLLCAKK